MRFDRVTQQFIFEQREGGPIGALSSCLKNFDRLSQCFYVPAIAYSELAGLKIKLPSIPKEKPLECWDLFIPDGPKSPMPFQYDGIGYLAGRTSAILADDMGLGKTLQALWALRSLYETGEITDALIVCPKRVIKNWKDTILEVLGRCDWIDIVHFEGVYKIRSGYDVLVVDECFPYDTLINTANGRLKIGDIVEHNLDVLIESWNHETRKVEYKPINRMIKKENTTTLVKVVHKYGEFVCTANHKIWTVEDGWTEASHLGGKTLSTLRDKVHVQTKLQTSYRKVLRNNMWRKKCRKSVLCQNDHEQPNEESRNPRESLNSIERQALACSQGRERYRTDGYPRENPRTSLIIEARICNKNEAQSTYCTTCLQGRSGASRNHDSYRDRRPCTQHSTPADSRQEENQDLRESRVVSVEVLEQRSYDQYRRGSGSNCSVYNLEIADNHNYFAEDVLVSNCHNYGREEAKRTFFLQALRGRCKRCWGLTGTPIRNKAKSFYITYKIVTGAVVTWQQWEHVFVAKSPWGEKPKNIKFLQKIVMSLTMRRLKSEVTDLPPASRVVLRVPLQGAQKKLYQDLNQELIGQLETMDARTIYFRPNETLAKMSRLLECAVHPGLLGQDFSTDDTAKFPAIDDIIEEAVQTQKVIIWSEHPYTLEQAADRWSAHNPIVVHGGMSDGIANERLTAFLADDKHRILCASIKAFGEGLNLQVASVAIWLDLGWDLSKFLQSQDRIDRIGQNKLVTFYFVLAEGTIETYLWDTLLYKQDVMAYLTGKADAPGVSRLALLKTLRHMENSNEE